jgi:AcrR family transcriptional regulator
MIIEQQNNHHFFISSKVEKALMSKKKKKDQNRKEVWIVAGRDQFAEHGLKGINIDHLSKTVGIARTSFYHFFKTKDQFLREVVDYWVQDGSMRLLKIFKKIDDPREQLLTIYELALGNNVNDQFKSQMRNAALKNKFLKKKLEETETLRIEFMTQLFRDFGFDNEDSKERALIGYQIYLGFLEFHKTTGYNQSEIKRLQDIAITILLD